MNNSRSTVASYIAAALAAAVALAAVWLFRGSDGGGVAVYTPNPMSKESPPHAEATPAKAAPTPADYTLRIGEVMRLRASELPHQRPVTLGLTLAVASPNSAPLEAIVMDESGRRIDLRAQIIGAAKERADLEIESSWLSPGTYLIHLETNESSHLPLRRYPLIVLE